MASRAGDFLSEMYGHARQLGLPDPAARLAAAQAALETGYGRAVKGNNFFGIKAGRSWKGSTQNLKTWEEVSGKRVNITDRFRSYKSPVESIKDWAQLVSNRFPGVFSARTFDEAAAALNAGKPGGYATDSRYASKLGQINSLVDRLDIAQPQNVPVPTPAPPRAENLAQMAAYAPATPASTATQALENLAAPAPGTINPEASQATYASPLGMFGSRVTSDFGGRRSPMGIGSTNHRGIDMTATHGRGQTGYPANSIAPGVVTHAGPRGGYGNLVEVQHDNGMRSRYGHLEGINVEVGQRIGTGMPIGTVGNTGRSTGAHLHFEMLDESGRQLNPTTMIDLAQQPVAPTPASRTQATNAQAVQQAAQSMEQGGVRGLGQMPSNVAVAETEKDIQALEAQMAGQPGWASPVAMEPGREPPAPFDALAALNPVAAAQAAPAPATAAPATLSPEAAAQYQYYGQTRSLAPALPALPSTEVRDLPVAAIDETVPPATLPALPAAVPQTAPRAPAAQPMQTPNSVQQQSAPNTGMNAIAGTFGAPQGTTAKSAWGDNSFTSLGDGRVSFTNEFGHTRTLSPEDYGFPDTMSRPAAQAQQQVDRNVSQAQRGFLGIPEASKGIGGMARGFGGGLAGGMIGSVLGPVGGLLGSYLGSQIAAGKNPFSMGGNRLATSFGRPVSALSPNELSGILASNYTPGLSFPTAPTGGVLSNGNAPSFGDMAGISPAAAAAISDGRAGLY